MRTRSITGTSPPRSPRTSRSLSALREELHVRAEDAGSISGPVIFRRRRRARRLRAPAQGGYSVPSIIEPDFMLQKCGTPQSFAMLAHCEQESAALIASQI